ncbi:MAG: coiled-coil protein [Candidatus Bathyarchaeia archaeon]
MTEKQTPSQITNINTQIDKLKEQTREANAQIKKFVEKRDELHEKVRKTREEVNQLKVERDALNQKVKELKQQRDAIRVNVTPIMDEVKGINEKVEALKKNLPKVSQRELKKEHDAIEWKISTTSLDLHEEKRLIEQVKELEIQLSGYKKIDNQRKKLKELYEHKKTFDAQADVYHKELTDLAKKSQDLHAVMMEKLASMKKDRADADALHQSFVNAKEQNNGVYEQIRLLIAQSTGIRASIREQYQTRRREDEARRKDFDEKRKQQEEKRKQEQAERAVKEAAIKEKIGTEAREKLNRGEKVSWEEFAMMLGDEDDEAETQA